MAMFFRENWNDGVVFVLIVISMSFLQPIVGQNLLINSQKYGIKEGLLGRDVQCINQDSLGFIWVGTRKGLNRFDGLSFEWFTKSNGSLNCASVNHIIEDIDSELWLINTHSKHLRDVLEIDIFNPYTHRVISFEDKFGDIYDFSAKDIMHFQSGQNGSILFITEAHQVIYYGENPFQFQLTLRDIKEVLDVEMTNDNTLWLVYHKTHQIDKHDFFITNLDKSGKVLSTFEIKDASYFSANKSFQNQGFSFYVNNFHGTQAAEVCFINEGVLTKLPAEAIFGNHDSKIEFDSIESVGMIIKNDLFTLIESWGELILLENRSDFMLKMQKKNTDFINTNDLFSDFNENIWLGTAYGLYRLRIRINRFKKLLHDYKPDKISTRSIISGAKKDLYIIAESNSDFWRIDSMGTESLLKFGQLRSIPDFNSKRTSLKLKSGDIAFVSGNSLVIKDFESGLILGVYIIPGKGQHDGFIWSLHESPNGLIWLGGEKGEMWYLEDEEIKRIGKLDKALIYHYVYQIFENNVGETWVVTDAGIFVLDINKRKIVNRYWNGGKGIFYLPFDNIYHVYQDRQGIYWLATEGSGLIKWDLANFQWNKIGNNWLQFTREDGLSSSTIYAVIEDDFENLWLSSDYGLMKFNKLNNQVKTYFEEDGISDNEFNRISFFKDKAGIIYFGSLNGITCFNPADFKTDSHSSGHLVVTDYKQFINENQKVENKTALLKTTNQIVLQPGDEFRRLQFSMLGFDDFHKQNYAYFIEGVNKSWIYQKENFIQLPHLPYGSYVLKIKGQLASGEWIKQILSVNIEVLKPFYLKFGFLSLIGVVLLGGISFSWYRRIKVLQRREEMLERKVYERTITIQNQAEELRKLDKIKSNFFANMTHELRTPLTLVQGPIQAILKRKDLSKKSETLLLRAESGGRDLSRLISSLLDLSKMEAGKLENNEKPEFIYPLLQKWLASFESHAQTANLLFTFQYKAEKDLQILLDIEKLEIIINNLLSNAIKFTNYGGKIEFVFEDNTSKLLLIVKDSGRGISVEDRKHVFERYYQSKDVSMPIEGGTGIGLALCYEYLQIMGGTIWLESELGKGATFYVELPKKSVLRMNEQPYNLTENRLRFNSTAIKNTVSTARKKINKALVYKGRSLILLVEDNHSLREYVQSILSEFYNVITAKNGLEALNILDVIQLNNIDIDLIVSDIMMPVMDGYQLLEKVKSYEKYRTLPFIMLTARVEMDDKLKALRMGVDDYLLKPFQEEELLIRIDNLIENYSNRKQFRVEAEFAEDTLDQQASNLSTPAASEDKAHVVSKKEQDWLAVVEVHVISQISNPYFIQEDLASFVNLSKRQLHRKIKKIVGLPPNQYIQEIRLNFARDLLVHGKEDSVKAVSLSVGYKKVNYFSQLYVKRFGIKPSAYFEV